MWELSNLWKLIKTVDFFNSIKYKLYMKSIKNTKTEQNLIFAFSNETQAVCRYKFYSKKAKKEGFINVSLELERISNHELSHAKNFFKFFEGGEVKLTASFDSGYLKDTDSNLNFAINLEKNESEKLYPQFAKVAKNEGFEKIAALFNSISEAEKNHLKILRKLLREIENKDKLEYKDNKVFECIKCGYLYVGKKPPLKCPACFHGTEYFIPLISNNEEV